MNIKFTENSGDIVVFKVLEYQIRSDEDYILFKGIDTECCFYNDGDITSSESLHNVNFIEVSGEVYFATKESYRNLIESLKIGSDL